MQKSYFSENIKTLRKSKKITLAELSEAINVSKSTISDYENDKFSPTINVCRKIADYFNLSIDDLEFSDISDLLQKNPKKEFSSESLPKLLADSREFAEVLEKQKNELQTELRLQKQKVDSLLIQLRLQEQLNACKQSKFVLLETQIILLEEKVKLIERS